ncbi:ABC transporter substrate-binding protein [Motilimonas cestriensis]|uniref:ABC transporter substrate-binding protein n=1 Tax=Motilimonas cestriensis TaxID=2742685 RepID=A0ABS8WAV0_9GAMM|nr:ABC transporter substrate-binding protein [Motilimonas cestriensis]MCE2595395.1 ABC transporter substrate-binding protein [Motilimonas cestriensis]
MRILYFVSLLLLSTFSLAAPTWNEIKQQAQGQTIYFYAWGGSQTINDYIQWAGDQAKQQYGIKVIHVKVSDTGTVVNQVLAEKTAANHSKGKVDLIWINGENFAAMKEQQLLFGPFTANLPNMKYTDATEKPSIAADFTVPVDGLEAPWGMAQLVFMADSARVKNFPRSMNELFQFLQQNPGQFSYPKLPDFHGMTFVKQALIETTNSNPALYDDVSKADFSKVTAPLWQFLDQLHPLMWRKGNAFVSSQAQLKAKLNDGEISIALSFNPNDAANSISNNELPASVKSYVHQGGSLGNTHFVAIPYNSSNTAAAQVFANWLMSPQAQARKADPQVWGDPTVLSMHTLTPQQQAIFNQIKRPPASLSEADLGPILLEPHPSWVAAIEQAWLRRYGQ